MTKGSADSDKTCGLIYLGRECTEPTVGWYWFAHPVTLYLLWEAVHLADLEQMDLSIMKVRLG